MGRGNGTRARTSALAAWAPPVFGIAVALGALAQAVLIGLFDVPTGLRITTVLFAVVGVVWNVVGALTNRGRGIASIVSGFAAVFCAVPILGFLLLLFIAHGLAQHPG